MSQQTNATVWNIDNSSGHPQMIKVVQSAGKSIGSIMSNVSGQPVKLFKATGPESSQTYTHIQPGQIKNSKIITKTIPYGGGTAQTFSKTPDGQIIKKTIRLTPQQIQNLKFINNTPTTKIQQIRPQQSLIKQPPQSPNQKLYHISPPILDHSGHRKRHESMDLDFTPEKRRKTTEKVGKGLRHFSMKVCEKVREKGSTSYNEVADELVHEFTNPTNNNALHEQYDQKNIRRRVYDALNVLMAMNIISKEKKEIKWIGLPSNSVQECQQLENEKKQKLQRISEKTKNLQELIKNQISFKNLAQRNMDLEKHQGRPASNSCIQLPFIVVNTNKKTVIDCSISHDKMEYIFNFNEKFEIHDDLEVLKQIGMLMGLDEGKCNPESLEKLKLLVPKALEEYVIQLASGKPNNVCLNYILDKGSAGPSNLSYSSDDFLESQLDDDNSRQSSSYDPNSPSHQEAEFTDDDVSDISTDD